MTTHTIDEAFDKFTLVKGTPGDGNKTACITSLLNWVWQNGPVSDALECGHPFIRSMLIAYNDADDTTDEQMHEAARLGVDGALDTWWIPVEVILSYFGDFERSETPTQTERLVKMLTGVAAWKLDKVKRSLNRASLNRANLNRANLNRANLNRANLNRASLNRANLNRANLDRASLNGASLNGANLNRANLDLASLNGANLNGANLNRANLNGANLNRANLDLASLSGANLYGANLDLANLYRAVNLEHAFYLDKTVGKPASLPDGWEYKGALIVRKS